MHILVPILSKKPTTDLFEEEILRIIPWADWVEFAEVGSEEYVENLRELSNDIEGIEIIEDDDIKGLLTIEKSRKAYDEFVAKYIHSPEPYAILDHIEYFMNPAIGTQVIVEDTAHKLEYIQLAPERFGVKDGYKLFISAIANVHV